MDMILPILVAQLGNFSNLLCQTYNKKLLVDISEPMQAWFSILFRESLNLVGPKFLSDLLNHASHLYFLNSMPHRIRNSE
jgi:hypothetical protein